MQQLSNAVDAFDRAPPRGPIDGVTANIIAAARRAIDEWSGFDIDDEEDDDDRPISAHDAGLSILKKRSVAFTDGHEYPTAMHCFQAQKAPDAMRVAFETCPLDAALKLGRTCTIDVASWDGNRKALMTDILRAQVAQHDDLRDAVRDHADDYTEDVMRGDAFWSATLPVIWQELKQEISSKKPRVKASASSSSS